jgi:hypothetical protein
VCPFTRDIGVFRDGTAECAYTRAGTCGDGSERGFFSAARAIQYFQAGSGCEAVPGAECNLRPDARVALVFFTDTGELTPITHAPPGQADGSVGSWVSYFRDYNLTAPGAQKAQVHGILCPFRPTPENPAPCSDAVSDPSRFDRYSVVIRELGGTEASIRDDSESNLMDSISRIVEATIAGACCGDGVVQSAEDCDDGDNLAQDCCGADCQFTSSAVECRPAADTCDAPEFCTGESVTCPPDALKPAGTICRAVAETCDVVEMCTGQDFTCPADTQLEGLDRLHCICAAGLSPSSCAEDGVPPPVMRRFSRACRLVQRADQQVGRRADLLLRRAARRFTRARAAAARAELRGRIGNDCATGLDSALPAMGS